MKTLIPYMRQSRAKEKTVSITDQRTEIKKWVERNEGYKLAPEVVEGLRADGTRSNASGGKSWRERELGSILKDIADGKADGIIVAQQNRLSRENGKATAEVWESLEAADARLVCVHENSNVTPSDDRYGESEFNYGLNALIARREWRRFKAAWGSANDKCARGGVYQGALPVGYAKGRTKPLPNTEGILPDIETKQLTKNADAVAIKAAFELKAGGGSYSECRHVLEAAGVKTGTGLTTWGATSVRSLLRNAIYKGTITNGHEHVFAEYAVVSPGVWEAAQAGERAEDAAPKTAGRRDAGDWALLGGLVKCGGCGKRVAPNSNRRKLVDGGFTDHREYACKRTDCDAKGRANAEELEAYALEEAYAYFAAAVEANGGAGHGQDTDSDKLTGLEIEAEEARKRMGAFVSAVDPTDAGFAERVAELRATVQAAEAAVTDEREATRVIVTPEEMRAAFEEADLAGRRGLVRMMLDGVVVSGRKKDGPVDERTDIDFRVLVFGGVS